MKCRVCGSRIKKRVTDLPFKAGEFSIVIVKRLPVLQCSRCNDFTLPDRVMARVEKILQCTDKSTELEVVQMRNTCLRGNAAGLNLERAPEDWSHAEFLFDLRH